MFSFNVADVPGYSRAVLPLALLSGMVCAQPAAKPAPTPSRPITEAPVRKAAPEPATPPGKPGAEEAAAAETRKMMTLTAVDQLDLIVDDVRRIDNLAISIPLANSLVARLARFKPDRCRQLVTELYDRVENQIKDNADRLGSDTVKFAYHSQARAIISIASGFDRDLMQQLIDRLETSESFSKVLKKHEGTYSVAKDLLDSNPQQAVQLAAQAAEDPFTVWALVFLGSLRQKDPAKAKTLTNQILASMETRKYPTIKELVFLHPYIFLTKTVPYFEPLTHQLGRVYNVDYGKDLENQTIDVTLATRYTRLGVSLMMQPDRYLDMYGPLRANEADDLIFIDRFLLPAAQTYQPSVVEALQERRTALLASMSPELRAAASSTMTNFDANRVSARPSLEDLLQKAESPKTSNEQKARLYFDAARLAAEKREYARAMDLVGKIPDPGQRQTVREFVAYEIAQAELAASKFEDAYTWIRDDRDPVRKGAMLMQIANAMSQGKTHSAQRLSQILIEASILASSLTPGTDRLVMLGGLAALQARTEPAQALETINRFVETANGAPDPIDGMLTVQRTLKLDQSYFTVRLYASPLTLQEAIGALARDHFMPLVAMVRNISDPTVRAKAMLATCDRVLAAAPVEKPAR